MLIKCDDRRRLVERGHEQPVINCKSNVDDLAVMLPELGHIRMRGHVPKAHYAIFESNGKNIGVVRMECNASGTRGIRNDVDEDTVGQEQVQSNSISSDSDKIL